MAPGLNLLFATFTPDDAVNYSVTYAQALLVLYTPRSSPILEDFVSVGSFSEGVFDASTDRLYMVDRLTEDVVSIRASTNEVLEHIALPGMSPGGLAIDVAGRRLMVIDLLTATLVVLDLSTNNIAEQISLPATASRSIAFNPSTGRVYVAGGGTLHAIDLTLAPGVAGRVSSITPQLLVADIVVNTTSNLIYARSANGLFAIEGDPHRANFHQVLETIPTSSSWHDLALNTRTGRVFEIDSFDWRLRVIDGDRSSATFNTIVAEFSLQPQQAGPSSIAINPITDRMYVFFGWPLDSGPFSVQVMDASTYEVLSVTPLPSDDPALVSHGFGRFFMNPSTEQVYVTGASKTMVLTDRAAAILETPDEGGAGAVTVHTAQASITFTDVTGAGATTVEAIDAADLNLSVPGQFAIEGALAYEITTTALVVPPITLCFNAGSVEDPQVFASLRVLHGENGALVDRTTSREFATGTICAEVDSLSPFVIVVGARGAVQRLIKQVNDSATLTRGQNQSLTAKLAAAVKQLDKANGSAARLQIEAFSNELRALVDAGRVSAVVANPLLAAAAELAAKL